MLGIGNAVKAGTGMRIAYVVAWLVMDHNGMLGMATEFEHKKKSRVGHELAGQDYTVVRSSGEISVLVVVQIAFDSQSLF